jgi:4-hydroxybenzoate polyprenyltransferase
MSFIIATILLYILYNKNVVITIVIYILCNILYSWKLKFINLIDVFCVAGGFILRIYCGAFAINIGVSDYLFLVTLFLSLFLVFSKRKAELKRIQSVARVYL